MARWKVNDGELAPQCTHCGTCMPFARYSRRTGLNGREITPYCPECGVAMEGIDECRTCPEAKDGKWQENGIFFACRGNTWVYGKKQNARILEKD